MAQFHDEKIGMFLGVVRKYMQMRGGLSQKDLSDVTEVGVSTMSRFLNQKTADINPQLVAKIVAKLEIPLHEMIDFVEESYAERFIRLVKFYKSDEEQQDIQVREDDRISKEEALARRAGEAKRSAKATISIGGKKRVMTFEPENKVSGLNERIDALPSWQKAYISNFLKLDMEGRDLLVNMGKAIFTYLEVKDKGNIIE